MSGPRHIFLVAGEASGDRLGADLMAGLKRLAPRTRLSGVGGPGMEAQGLESLFAFDDLAVMGLAEVLPRLPRLFARLRQTVDAIKADPPDALVTIDSPDFGLRVARRARRALPALATVHYVAPTVWAWRPGRAAKMARDIDHVLALFPFEPPYMERAAMGCDFVGHPVATAPRPTPTEIGDFRARHGLPPDRPLLVVLPGSRPGEVARLAPVFRDTLARVLAARPDLGVVVPAAPAVAGTLAAALGDWPGSPVLIDPRSLSTDRYEAEKSRALAAADLAFAASGTVSLELAAAGTPMVIAYRLNWLTTRIVKARVALDTATLVNILSGRNCVPEFLFEDCRADAIAPALVRLIDDDEARRAQTDAFGRVMEMLGRGGEPPGLRAARALLAALGDQGRGRPALGQ